MAGTTTDEYSPPGIHNLAPVPGAVEEEGKAFCCTVCTDGISSSISEKKVGENSLVGEGDSGCGSEMFWEGGMFAKANESRLKKCGFYTQTLRFEDEERPSNEGTHTIAIGRDVEKGVAEVYGALF